MKMNASKFTALAVLFFALAACGDSQEKTAAGQAVAPGAPLVEIAFLNHPPVIGALKDVDKLLAGYGAKVKVVRYDLETDQGQAFADSKGLAGHTPIAIFVNGAMELKVRDRTVKFYSFPEGKGTWMVESGTWTVADLDAAIKQALGSAGGPAK